MKNIKVKRVFLLLTLILYLLNIYAFSQNNKEDNKEDARREAIVNLALEQEGKPYIRGAVGPASYDCSGYVYYIVREAAGIQLPRMSKNIYKKVKFKSKKALLPGDLVFFHTTHDGSPSHVGIYLGENKFISALSDGKKPGVVISKMDSKYWKARYINGGSIL